MNRVVIGALLLVGAESVTTLAQDAGTIPITIPSVCFSGPINQRVPASAVEAVYHIEVQKQRAHNNISSLRPDYPKDSVRSALTANAQVWLAALPDPPVRGIQLDAQSQVSLAAGQDAVAQRHIAARLAAPGLSIPDRAHTYLVAVSTFASAEYPERLAIAERYVAALDTLGSSAAYWQCLAHLHLTRTYYQLGRPADVIRHGIKAVAAGSRMDFVDRHVLGDSPDFYAELVDALAGQPEAQASIAALNTTLRNAVIPPAALIAQDSNFYRLGMLLRQRIEGMIVTTQLVGTQGADLVGNYWVNLPTPGTAGGPQQMTLADGRIHVVQFGSYACPGCVAEMTSLQRLQERYPNIQVVTATWTTGSWGFRLVTPDEEAEYLRDFYTQRLKIRYPISIWKGEKKPTEDGGLLPEDAGPNLHHYPMAGKPNTWVIDGKGRIRRLIIGFTREEQEPQLVNLIAFLLHETH